jgi:hypothetical protein
MTRSYEVSPDQFPGEGADHHLLNRFLEEGQAPDGWHRPAAECAALQQVLRQPREIQREFLLALLVRILWQFECKGRPAVARLFLLYDAAKLLLSRKLPWDGDSLTALVLLVTTPNIAQELGALVIRQVSWHEETPESVRRALKRLKKLGRFGGSIDTVLSRNTNLPPTSSPLKERQMRALMAHARRVPDEVSRRWWRKGVALVKDLGEAELADGLIPWVMARLESLQKDHPRLLRGLVVLLGGGSSDSAAQCLDRIVRWGYGRRQGYGFRDRHLAHTGIRALGRLNTSLAVGLLVVLGSELRYPSATQELLSTLRVLADRRGGSLHSLVEVETAQWAPGSPMGKRLWHSHVRRLERCLRTGRSWPVRDWLESYQDSPLLGEMGRRLIWEDQNTSFRWEKEGWRGVDGLIVRPDGHVRLWHPVEGKVPWSVKPSPFPQADREVFHEADFERCLVRQYQFAALASQRDWHYRSVGRFRESSAAVVRLGGYRAWLEVERACGTGPFSKEGLSIQIRLKRFGSEPGLESFPARARSEVIRDVHLFTTVARVRSKRDRGS